MYTMILHVYFSTFPLQNRWY